jgi:hypothetical protein
MQKAIPPTPLSKGEGRSLKPISKLNAHRLTRCSDIKAIYLGASQMCNGSVVDSLANTMPTGYAACLVNQSNSLSF